MGTKAIFCSTCHTYYNGEVYSQCPYCSRGKKNLTADNKNTQKRGSEMVQDQPTPQQSSDADVPTSQPTVSSVGKTYDVKHPMFSNFRKKPPQEEPKDPVPSKSEAPSTDPYSGSDEQPLSGRIDSVGKTTSKFISLNGNEVVYPVVGWLVCVKGVYYGKSFPLKAGANNVGRNETMEVALLKDMSVSSQSVVRITYDSKGNEFNALPGQSNSSLCYVNGSAIYERIHLNGFEEIELGDSEKNKFVFVPLCSPVFHWSSYPSENDSKSR